jgi:hypothetical protein
MTINANIIEQALEGNSLKLSAYNLNDDDIQIICDYLKTHPNITELDVSSNQINDVSAKLIAGIGTLQKLNISATQITNEGLIAISFMSALLSLEAYWLPSINDPAAIALSGSESLRVLNLSHSVISDQGAICLLQNKLLKSLTLNACSNLSKRVTAVLELPEITPIHIANLLPVNQRTLPSLSELSMFRVAKCIDRFEMKDQTQTLQQQSKNPQASTNLNFINTVHSMFRAYGEIIAKGAIFSLGYFYHP